MEAPPSTTPQPLPTAALYSDSIDASPHSRRTDSWDPPQPKLRLMCSYGGHIVPRPHDKTLCYIGGDTRIIVIDRQTSLSDLAHRLSKTLLQNQSFALKYQLPNEDLDSLISVTSDEDLENLIEEYDRLNSSGSKPPGRIRLFLFPKSTSNIEQVLVETISIKSEEWFLDALNGKAKALSDRGFSESSSVNCLLGLDDDNFVGNKSSQKDGDTETLTLIEGSKIGGNGNGVANNNNQDVHSVPDSPMLDTTSSFGSTSSSPSVANLPPIKVHVEDNPKLGIEDQFQQLNVNLAPPQQKQEDVGGFVAAGTVVAGLPVVVGGGEYVNRGFSDDERSDHGGYRKVQQIQPQVQAQLQPQQIAQFQQRQQTGAFDLPSPDSASSEGSITNPLSRQRQAMYQEQIVQIQQGNTRVPSNQADLKTVDQSNTKIQMQQQVQESGYVLSSQYDQNHPQIHHPQQFVHAGTQYISTMPSYYQVYPPQQQQHHQHQPVMDQQYPVYFMPARQAQGYNLPAQQHSYSELAPNATLARPQTPPSVMAPHPAFNQPINPPSSKPEVPTGVYRTAAPQFVQGPSGPQQAQYVGYSQVHHPSQSIAPSSTANPGYTYEFSDPTHAQMYYTQHLPPQLAAQYQTMTSAPMDASAQLSAENIKQQVRTLQP